LDWKQGLDFWPTDHMTETEQHYAIIRFAVYLSLLLVWYYGSGLPLLIALAVVVARPPVDQAAPVAPATCVSPTPHNPYMNVTMADIMDGVPRGPACKPPTAAAAIHAIEQDMGYRDQDDLFDRKHSFRTFHTQPSTEYPADQSQFLKYMYPLPPSCKEKTDQCTNFFEMLQAKRQM